MNTGYHIHYLRRQEIDLAKWDRCVKNAPNGWLCARSFFLDGIGAWDALICGDYDHIMPLPKKRKYGLSYVYIPPFTGQLGIIGAGPVSQELTDQFISAIPASFSLADILLNEQNPGCSLTGIRSAKRTNYVIPLQETYASVYDRYSGDAKKNIRRTQAFQLSICSDIRIDIVIEMYKEAYGKKNRHISQSDFNRLAILGKQCMEQDNGFTIGIRNKANELVASAFFGKDEKRIYYILGAPNQQGRESNAVHSLIDEVIKRYAGSGLAFDFEGSDIPSVAQFYRKFGPEAMEYDLVRVNRLPRWLQWLRAKAAP
jgi:hypothetical protein